MTETSVKHIKEDCYKIDIQSDEVDCQVKGMSLVSMLATIPKTEINQENHVILEVKTDTPQAKIQEILHQLVT